MKIRPQGWRHYHYEGDHSHMDINDLSYKWTQNQVGLMSKMSHIAKQNHKYTIKCIYIHYTYYKCIYIHIQYIHIL